MANITRFRREKQLHGHERGLSSSQEQARETGTLETGTRGVQSCVSRFLTSDSRWRSQAAAGPRDLSLSSCGTSHRPFLNTRIKDGFLPEQLFVFLNSYDPLLVSLATFKQVFFSLHTACSAFKCAHVGRKIINLYSAGQRTPANFISLYAQLSLQLQRTSSALPTGASIHPSLQACTASNSSTPMTSSHIPVKIPFSRKRERRSAAPLSGGGAPLKRTGTLLFSDLRFP